MSIATVSRGLWAPYRPRPPLLARNPVHGCDTVLVRARWAAIRLHERIEGRGHDVRPQVLPTRLVGRGSCGCPWEGPDLREQSA